MKTVLIAVILSVLVSGNCYTAELYRQNPQGTGKLISAIQNMFREAFIHSQSMVVDPVNGTHLFAWNDLGMHCADSDFSIFTLLPPFNNLNAQLVVSGKLVNIQNNSSYVLTYEATSDPTGSVNTSSQDKTNFWEYDQPLFGADLMPDVGLTGNPTPSYYPAPFTWSDEYKWFEAPGIPITPIDDDLNANYYPMVKVTALDSSGRAIASSKAVLPVSSEINCDTCHASFTGSGAAQTCSRLGEPGIRL